MHHIDAGGTARDDETMQAGLQPDGVRKDAYEASVVGSGFGGAVAACRLAQAGVDVAVLERGARFPLGSFPRHLVNRDSSLLWHHGGPYDIRPLNDILVVQAAGYGGGSLVYANVQMRAPAGVFDEGWPPGYSRATLDPYYDLVAYMLDITPVEEDPSTGKLPPKARLMGDAATRLGRRKQHFRSNLAVWFEGAGSEPTPNKFGVPQSPDGTKATAQLLGREIRGVHGASRLMFASALGKRAGVDRVEADLVHELRHHPLGLVVVARDRNANAIGVRRRPTQVPEDVPEDGVERLHDAGTGEVGLKKLARGGAVTVQLLEVAVAPRVVVVGVDHDLSFEALFGKLPEATKRHRNHDDLAEVGCLLHSHRPSARVELHDQIFQACRTARVAERYLVSGIKETPGELPADLARTNDSDSQSADPFSIVSIGLAACALASHDTGNHSRG